MATEISSFFAPRKIEPRIHSLSAEDIVKHEQPHPALVVKIIRNVADDAVVLPCVSLCLFVYRPVSVLGPVSLCSVSVCDMAEVFFKERCNLFRADGPDGAEDHL